MVFQINMSQKALLHIAVENENPEIVHFLLTRKEIDVNVRSNKIVVFSFNSIHQIF